MSETVKVVCYKSKTLSDGKHPLMVRVCKDGKKKYQSLGIYILPSHWDFKKNEPNDNCPNRDEIRLLIQQRLFELQTFRKISLSIIKKRQRMSGW